MYHCGSAETKSSGTDSGWGDAFIVLAQGEGGQDEVTGCPGRCCLVTALGGAVIPVSSLPPDRPNSWFGPAVVALSGRTLPAGCAPGGLIDQEGRGKHEGLWDWTPRRGTGRRGESGSRRWEEATPSEYAHERGCLVAIKGRAGGAADHGPRAPAARRVGWPPSDDRPAPGALKVSTNWVRAHRDLVAARERLIS
ncbi:hypothetical protein GCM10018955_40950 [Planomonospora venezuelensis]